MSSAEGEGAAAPAKTDPANLFKKRRKLGEAAEKITALKPGSIVVCSEFEQKGVHLFYGTASFCHTQALITLP